jgi:hypothetical protein
MMAVACKNRFFSVQSYDSGRFSDYVGKSLLPFFGEKKYISFAPYGK